MGGLWIIITHFCYFPNTIRLGLYKMEKEKSTNVVGTIIGHCYWEKSETVAYETKSSRFEASNDA